MEGIFIPKKFGMTRQFSLDAGDGTIVPVAGADLPMSTMFFSDEDVPAALDRASFTESLGLVALVVKAPKTAPFMERLKDVVFSRPKLRSVLTPDAAPEISCVELPADALPASVPRRAVLLNEKVSVAATEEDLLAGLSAEDRAWALGEGARPVRHALRLGYELLTAEQVLRKLLPAAIAEVPSSFETAGHVAHLNLREEVLPFKHLIAQVLLDKNAPRIKSIVNKTGMIETTFRTFPLEVLAGEADLVVNLKEGGATFRFDFAKVYWNSRLSYEHARLPTLICARHWDSGVGAAATGGASGAGLVATEPEADPAEAAGQKRQAAGGGDGDGDSAAADGPRKKQKKAGGAAQQQQDKAKVKAQKPSERLDPAAGKGLVVADLMAGVGPFAVPLALRGAAVLANDLNPDSYVWLRHNAGANRVADRLEPFNLCGRRFVAVLRGREPLPGGGHRSPAIWFDHAILNLPASGIDFLDAFRGLLYTRSEAHVEASSSSSSSSTSTDASDASTSAAAAAAAATVPPALRGLVREALGERRLPMVHVYCFEKELEGEGDGEGAACRACARASLALGCPLPRADVDVHVVRYVSPQKPMLCLSFRLPLACALAPPVNLNDYDVDGDDDDDDDGGGGGEGKGGGGGGGGGDGGEGGLMNNLFGSTASIGISDGSCGGGGEDGDDDLSAVAGLLAQDADGAPGPAGLEF